MNVINLIPADGYEKHKENSSCKCNPSVKTTNSKALIIPIGYRFKGDVLLIIHNPLA